MSLSKITQVAKGEFVYSENRHLFSSYCSKTQHKNCSGGVSKLRNPTGICPCKCHSESDQ